MQRKDRECSDAEFIASVLTNATELVLSLNTNTFPYAVPLNFVLYNGKIYFHCRTEGKKLDCIVQDERVAFTAFIDVTIDAEKATTRYCSVCGTGRARLVEDRAEKIDALQALSNKYHSHCPCPPSDARLAQTAVVKIEIVQVCGKRNIE